MYVRRDRSGLAFGKKRRHTPRWRYALWLAGLAFTAVVIWQFDRVQPKVLHQLGIGPTPTAPPPSTTRWCCLKAKAIAAAISSSETSTVSSTYCWISGRV